MLMQGDIERLNEYIKEKKIPVNLIVVNMSKTMSQAKALKLNGVPRIKMFQSDGSIDEFNGERDFKEFVQFMKETGIKWNE